MGNQNKKVKIFDERFEIISIIGRGECSVVYKARHITSPFTEVALKVLVDKNSQNSTLEKLRKEALAMVSCRHKYVIRLDDFRSFNDLSYICMEYAPFRDLRYYTGKRGGRLPVTQAIEFLKQILEALSFIHESGIIHRDIKPDNILVMNDSQIRLGDFGLTLLPTEELSPIELKKGIGTTDYLAPETIQGETYNASSDIYALGISFYELISGINPFSNVTLSRILDIRKDNNITPLNDITTGVPNYLVDIIKKAMAFDPNDRYKNASEMLRDLLNERITDSDNLQDENADNELDELDKTTPGSPIILTQSLIDESNQVKSNETTANDSDHSTQHSIDNRPYFSNDNDGENNYINNNSDELNFYSGNDNGTLMGDEGIVESNNSNSLTDTPTDKTNPTGKVDYSHDTIYSSSELLSKSDLNKEPQNTFNETVVDSQNITSSNMFDFYSGKNNLQASKEPIQAKSYNQYSKLKNFTVNKYLPIAVVVLSLLILIILISILFSNEGQESTHYEYSKLPLVYDGSDNFSFPNLPSGTYFGKINGLIPNTTLPLTFISDEKSKNITILIGIDGWKPISVNIETSGGNNLNFKGNGFVLRLSSDSDSDDKIISGHFKNIVSKESGKWQVKALK